MNTMKVKSAIAALLVALYAFLLFGGAVNAASASPFGVYVQDEAAILQPQTKENLYNRAVWLNERTGSAQIGIVTIPSLGNQSLEDAAVSKFRELGLGSKELNNGVLLLYTAKENHVRIEVGYGLEGRITDGKAGAILDQFFIPSMKAGDADKAFSETQLALLQEIAAEYHVDTSDLGAGVPGPSRVDRQEAGFLEGMPGYVKLLFAAGMIILIILDFKFTGGMFTYGLLSLLRRGGGGGGRGGGSGGGGSTGGGGASR